MSLTSGPALVKVFPAHEAAQALLLQYLKSRYGGSNPASAGLLPGRTKHASCPLTSASVCARPDGVDHYLPP